MAPVSSRRTTWSLRSANIAVSAPQATLVTPDKLTSFLDANYVTAASGKPGVEDAKASVVRVICVRK